MKNVSLEAIEKHVHTQYCDLKGIMQVDCPDSICSIYNLCNDYNFDTNDKFIIGFGFSEETTNGIGKRGQTLCRILFLEKSEYGNTYDEIKEKIKGKTNLKVKGKSFFVKYSDLSKYFKRYNFLLTSDLTENINNFDIEDID